MTALRKIFIIQLGLIALCTVVLILMKSNTWPSFLSGAVFITVNFALGVLVWKRVWDKKPIAWTIILLVSKYAILISVLYLFVVRFELALVPLLTGVTTLGGSLIIAAVTKIES
jgi:hypothetical protein